MREKRTKHRVSRWLATGGSLAAGLLLTACYTDILGDIRKSRTVELTTPGIPGGRLHVWTHNGRITVRGGESETCTLTATIEGRGRSEQDAIDRSEHVEVRLETSGEGVEVVLDKPDPDDWNGIAVHLDLAVPSSMSTEFKSHNGRVAISGVEAVSGGTHNGRIEVESIKGRVDVRSHNGRIQCTHTAGPVKLRTHNGKIVARVDESEEVECVVRTHNGGIDIQASPAFRGRVKLRTQNGGVHTDFPITIQGKVNKRRLDGAIGTGDGFLDLETHNGSIHLGPAAG